MNTLLILLQIIMGFGGPRTQICAAISIILIILYEYENKKLMIEIDELNNQFYNRHNGQFY